MRVATQTPGQTRSDPTSEALSTSSSSPSASSTLDSNGTEDFVVDGARVVVLTGLAVVVVVLGALVVVVVGLVVVVVVVGAFVVVAKSFDIDNE